MGVYCPLAMLLLLVAMETNMLKNGKKYINNYLLGNHIKLKLYYRLIHHIGLYRFYVRGADKIGSCLSLSVVNQHFQTTTPLNLN